MSSIPAAVRNKIVNANIPGIEGKIYRDIAPPSTPYPYITYSDRLADRSVLFGDTNVLARNYLIQIDLWEKRPQESAEIYANLLSVLENSKLEGTDSTIYRFRLYDIQRIVEFDDDVVHHAFSVNMYRKV